MGRVFGILVGIAAIIGSIYTVLQYYASAPVTPQPATSKPPFPMVALPPGPGPERAVGTRVQMRSPTTSALTVMTLMNYDVSHIHASLWALSNGKLVKLDSRTIPFIEAGGYAGPDRLPTPFTIGKMISCVQYNLNNHNVEMLDFYTNEGHSQQQLVMGTMTKYRTSVVEVDGGGRLCSSMPASAYKYI
jgi:hypothetical protein